MCLRRKPQVQAADPAAGRRAPARSWTRGEVVRDLRFYLILPGAVTPALVVTALFFHHLNLADAKGWSHAWITGNYVVFAGSGTAIALLVGPLIDRIGAVRLAPLMLLPMIASLALLAAVDHPLIIWCYLGLLGLSVGVAHTAIVVMWAELYGVGHLGAIRSMVTALAVFASALGPVALGVLLDSGLSIERSLLLFAGWSAIAAVLLAAGVTGRR